MLLLTLIPGWGRTPSPPAGQLSGGDPSELRSGRCARREQRPFARAMEDWLRAGKTIVMMTQVPYEGQRYGSLSGGLSGEGEIPADGGVQHDAGGGGHQADVDPGADPGSGGGPQAVLPAGPVGTSFR